MGDYVDVFVTQICEKFAVFVGIMGAFSALQLPTKGPVFQPQTHSKSQIILGEYEDWVMSPLDWLNLRKDRGFRGILCAFSAHQNTQKTPVFLPQTYSKVIYQWALMSESTWGL